MRKPVGLCALVVFLLGAVASAQTYYYNLDGGRYLHADPHCASIDEQYGDSMAEISLEQAQNMGLIEYCADCMGGKVAPAGSTGESTAVSLHFGGSGRDQIDYRR